MCSGVNAIKMQLYLQQGKNKYILNILTYKYLFLWKFKFFPHAIIYIQSTYFFNTKTKIVNDLMFLSFSFLKLETVIRSNFVQCYCVKCLYQMLFIL